MHDMHLEEMKDLPRPAVSRFKDLDLFFPANWAFHVYSMLSRFEVPYLFFWPVNFLYLRLVLFQHFIRIHFSMFSAILAFCVHFMLGGFKVTFFWLVIYLYLYFWKFFSLFASMFSFQHLLRFWCFSEHETIIFFSLLGISCLLIFEWIRNALLFFWSLIFSLQHLLKFWCFSEHETIIFFSLLGISCLLIFEWIRNALLFFWPLIFSLQHLLKFWCFSEHETIIFFSLFGISCLLMFEWIRNAQLFFWSLIFSFQHMLKFWRFLIMKLSSFSSYLAFRVYSYECAIYLLRSSKQQHDGLAVVKKLSEI